MKLIIDINEDYFEILKYEERNGNDFHPIKIIANGTPLPKGHGRLIDTDALVKKGDITKDYLNIFAPTIIEADNEGNEK